jgi:hypothetical protein
MVKEVLDEMVYTRTTTSLQEDRNGEGEDLRIETTRELSILMDSLKRKAD